MVTRTLFLHVVPSPLAVTLEITHARRDARGHHPHRLGGLSVAISTLHAGLTQELLLMTHVWRQNQKR